MSLRKTATLFSGLLFIVFIGWWMWLSIYALPDSELRGSFSESYGILALVGGLMGLVISYKWGGFKSYIGRSLIFFAFGLLCQFLGQSAYSIQYLIDHVENSYPSFGEIFFVLSVPSYILGVWFVAKASGSMVSLKSLRYKLVALAVPLVMVATSYYMFIKDVPMDGQSTIAIILNFFYPIGQAIFVALAITAFLLSNKILGGMMRKRVLFILFSLVFQYFADSIFLYKSIQGTWYAADFSEFLFAVSYSLMTFSFLDFASVFGRLKDNNNAS